MAGGEPELAAGGELELAAGGEPELAADFGLQGDALLPAARKKSRVKNDSIAADIKVNDRNTEI